MPDMTPAESLGQQQFDTLADDVGFALPEQASTWRFAKRIFARDR